MRLFRAAGPNPGPRRAAESIYAFLCRAEGAYWGRVRALLEQWFATLAHEAQLELKRRFEAGTPEQVVSAFWELYVHEGLRRSRFTLTPHPDVPDSNKHPDFLVEADGPSFYLECVVAGDPEEMVMSERRRRQVYDSVNKLANNEFFLNLHIEREGQSSPSGATLRRRVDAWLAKLDRAELRRRYEQAGPAAMPAERFEIGDWTFSIRPLPKSDERAGQPSRSAIGIFPGRFGYSEVRERLVDALEEKASRYGQLDRPYLIAVLSTGTYADSEDLIAALFGQDVVVLHPHGDGFDPEWTRSPNGLWSPSRNRRVSGVISATGLAPWSVQTQSPRLWLNPWAERPLELESDWLAPTPISPHGRLTLASAPVAADAFFALPPAWPGPEKPFV